MPGDPAERPRMTPAQYRLMERDAVEKHFLWNGEVFAMAGPSAAHNELVGALVEHARVALRGTDCRALPSDMRVWVPATDGYVYPDVTITCGPLDLARADGLETLRNPRVIFEVLSETSEAFDRGEKFDGYRSIESLTDYVLVSSTRRQIDHLVRQADGAWLVRAYRGTDVLPLRGIGIELSLDDLYAAAIPRVAPGSG